MGINRVLSIRDAGIVSESRQLQSRTFAVRFFHTQTRKTKITKEELNFADWFYMELVHPEHYKAVFPVSLKTATLNLCTSTYAPYPFLHILQKKEKEIHRSWQVQVLQRIKIFHILILLPSFLHFAFLQSPSPQHSFFFNSFTKC